MKSSKEYMSYKLGKLLLEAAPNIDGNKGCIFFIGKPKKPESLRKKQ